MFNEEDQVTKSFLTIEREIRNKNIDKELTTNTQWTLCWKILSSPLLANETAFQFQKVKNV